jgi:hypothetical protein
VDGIPAEATESWFFVKAIVALSPMLTLWAGGGIGWFLRRTHWARSKVPPPSAPNLACDEPACVAAPPL